VGVRVPSWAPTMKRVSFFLSEARFFIWEGFGWKSRPCQAEVKNAFQLIPSEKRRNAIGLWCACKVKGILPRLTFQSDGFKPTYQRENRQPRKSGAAPESENNVSPTTTPLKKPLCRHPRSANGTKLSPPAIRKVWLRCWLRMWSSNPQSCTAHRTTRPSPPCTCMRRCKF
jgi:hypothetical protein